MYDCYKQGSASWGVLCWLSDTSFQWPETSLGPFEPQDHRFPLPGMVGSSVSHATTASHSQPPTVLWRPRYDADVLVAELPYERQSTAFEQFVAINSEVGLAAVASDFWFCFCQQVPWLP